MYDCQINSRHDADSRLEHAVQKLGFLGAAIPDDGIADDVMSFDQACGLALMLKEIASDIEAVREWQHSISQQIAEAERVKCCGTSADGVSFS